MDIENTVHNTSATTEANQSAVINALSQIHNDIKTTINC